jgi:hypothetical protein
MTKTHILTPSFRGASKASEPGNLENPAFVLMRAPE